MNWLWTTTALIEASAGRLQGTAPDGVNGVSIDSRTIGAGEAFVAIRGDRFDGHDYVPAALRAGAALAIVSEAHAVAAEGPLLVVPDDPLDALRRIGIAARDRTQAAIVAVTGSVGKTGTKEMLRAAFSAIGAVHASVGSFNNHWGVPLTLARLPAEAYYGIFELGMNHAGEIRPLTRMVRPHVAIVTNVEAVHTEFFKDQSGIAEAKAEIFDGLEPGGTAVLNLDNPWFQLLSARARDRGAELLSFGVADGADIRLADIALEPDGSTVTADVRGTIVRYRLGAPGRHLAQNSLAVVAAATALGADLERIVAPLAAFRAPNGRGAQSRLTHPAGEFTLIDESYNANPASMRAALALLGQSTPQHGGRRIAVLGDMLELGPNTEARHRELASAIELAKADQVFLAGPLMENLWRDLPAARRGAYAEDAIALEPILMDAVAPGDVIMIKASLGARLGPLVAALKRRYGAAAQ